MKTLKKLTAVILLAALCFALFACSVGKTPGNGDSETETAGSQQTSATSVEKQGTKLLDLERSATTATSDTDGTTAKTHAIYYGGAVYNDDVLDQDFTATAMAFFFERNIADNYGILEEIKVSSGFAIDAGKNATAGKCTILALDGTVVARNKDSTSLSDVLVPGNSYVASFIVTRRGTGDYSAEFSEFANFIRITAVDATVSEITKDSGTEVTFSGHPKAEYISVIAVIDGTAEITPHGEFLCSYVGGVNADGHPMLITETINWLDTDSVPTANLTVGLDISVNGVAQENVVVYSAETLGRLGQYKASSLGSELESGSYYVCFTGAVYGQGDYSQEYVMYMYYIHFEI